MLPFLMSPSTDRAFFRFPLTDGINIERLADAQRDPHTLFRIDRDEDQYYLWTPRWRVDVFRRPRR